MASGTAQNDKKLLPERVHGKPRTGASCMEVILVAAAGLFEVEDTLIRNR
jgi:hypothetical protein